MTKDISKNQREGRTRRGRSRRPTAAESNTPAELARKSAQSPERVSVQYSCKSSMRPLMSTGRITAKSTWRAAPRRRGPRQYSHHQRQPSTRYIVTCTTLSILSIVSRRVEGGLIRQSAQMAAMQSAVSGKRRKERNREAMKDIGALYMQIDGDWRKGGRALPETAGGGIIFKARGGKALPEFVGLHAGYGTKLFEGVVFVAQLHVDKTEQHHRVGG